MNLFLDTNILIDVAANRRPFAKWAIKIFKDGKEGRFNLYTSSFSILTCYYIIEKQVGTKKAKRVISILLSRLHICNSAKQDFLGALSSKIEDYEDAVLHELALSLEKIDIIVTRNKKDFKHSAIKVMSSEELYD